MRKTSTRKGVRNLCLLALVIALTSFNVLRGQVSAYTFSQSSGTYTAITGGTVLGTAANDNQVFVDPAVLAGGTIATGVGFPIGFSFTYNGTSFDRFAVNTNGWISLGRSSVTPSVNITSVSAYSPISAAAGSPTIARSRIAGMAVNLAGQTGSEIRTELIGTAPNQVCVIQWTNYRIASQTGQSFSFQIRLNQFDNSVEVVYGTVTFSSLFSAAQVGLGGFIETDFNNRFTPSPYDWNTTIAGTSNANSCLMQSSVLAPVSGLTFKWIRITSAIDMQATALAAPATFGCFGSNQTVSVVIRNNATLTANFATDPVTVNCAVTGPNPTTFTPVVINTGTLAPATTQTVTISTTYDMSVNGAYVFSASTSITGDANTLNDAMPNTTITTSRVNTFPHTEGFSVTPSPAFLVQQVSGTGNWSIVSSGNMSNPTLAPTLNPGFAYFNSFSFPASTVSRLITPCYDMTTLNNPAIDVWISQNNAVPTPPSDRVEVRVSTDGGITWSASLLTTNRYNASFTTPGWLKVTVPLTAYSNNSSVRIALQGISQFGNNIAIDQIKVYDQLVNDLQPTLLVTPTTSACHSNAEPITVAVKNNGIGIVDFSVTPLTITTNITGASTQAFTLTVNSGTLGAGATANYTVTTTANMSAQGVHNFAINTSCSADGDNTNNNLAASVSVGDISSLPAVENFDGSRLGWTISQLSGTGNWTYQTGNMATPTLAPRSGTAKAYFNSAAFSAGTSSRLLTPCINFTGVTKPSLEFYMSANNSLSSANDRVEVRVSTDGGATFSSVLLTASRYDASFTTPGWKRYTLCLTSAANTANVKVAFDAISGFGNNLALEDVRFYAAVPAVAGTVSPASTNLCIGNTTTLTLAGNTGTIQWQSSPTGSAGSWTNIALATASTLPTGAITTTTFYRAVVTNTNACASSDTTTAAQVTVNPVPIKPISNITQCGGSVTLDALNAGASYLWSTGSTNQTITVTISGSYNVTITGANGCITKDTAVVTINSLPVVNLGSDTAKCGGTIVLNAQNAGATYLWNDNSTTQTLSAATSGTYFVTVTSAAGCIGRDTVNVTISSAPTVNLGADITQCGGSVVLNAQNAGATYLWNDNSTAQTLTVTASGTYFVTATLAAGCFARDTINVTINTLPTVNLGSDTTRCGGTVMLNAQNAGATYLWNDNSTAQTLMVSATGVYSVAVTGTNGCIGKDTINVTIDAPPTVNLGADIVQCAPGVTLDAQNSGATYLWNDNSTAQTLAVTTSGTYSVAVTTSPGCTGTDTINVTINPLPTVNLGSDTTRCGGTVMLDAQNAGATYLWNDNSTAQTLMVSATGVYSVAVTDANGCTGKDTINVTIDAPPTVNLGADIVQCAPGVTLDAQNSGATYLWNDNSTSQTLTVTTSGTYSVAVTTSPGCTGTDTINVTINPLPTVNLGSDTTRCGGTVMLDAQNAGATYLWNDNSTAQTLMVSATGVYSVAVTDANGCTGKDTINVTIDAPPTVNLGADIVQCANSLMLDAQITGATYLWNDNSTSQTLTVTTSGTYSVAVTTSPGCTGTDTINVTLNSLPIVNLGNDTVLCSGGTITLDAQNVGAAYLWNDNSTAQTLSVSSSGTYFVTVTGSNGCTSSDTINATIGVILTVDLGPDSTACAGALVLDAQNAGSTYLWNDGTTAQTLTVLTSDTYSVLVTDPNGCQASDTVNVIANPTPIVNLGADTVLCTDTLVLDAGNPGLTYLWNDNTTAQTLTAETNGMYSVTVTGSNGCSTTDMINVTLSTLPGVNLGADGAQCGSITLDAQNVAGSTYLWNDNTTDSVLLVTTSGTYYVTVTDPTGCSGSDTVNLVINTPPAVNLGSDTSQCQGTVTFDAGNAGAAYLWSDGSTNQTFIASGSGTYWVEVTDTNGCVATDTVNVTGGPVVDLGPDVTECGSLYSIDAQNPGATYLWSDGSTAQILSATTTGVYYVTVTDTGGCIGSDTISVTINPLPTVTFTLPIDSVCDNGGSIVLSGGLPAGGTYSGPGITNNILDPFVAPLGTQTITYSFTDALGCTGTATQQIYIDNCSGIAEQSVNGSVSLYPNPTNGIFTLQINTPVATEIAIEIFSVEGRLLMQQRVNTTGQLTLSVNLDQLANGIYYVHIAGENGLINKIKVVKQD